MRFLDKIYISVYKKALIFQKVGAFFVPYVGANSRKNEKSIRQKTYNVFSNKILIFHKNHLF
jgi:hypothetical protein